MSEGLSLFHALDSWSIAEEVSDRLNINSYIRKKYESSVVRETVKDGFSEAYANLVYKMARKLQALGYITIQFSKKDGAYATVNLYDSTDLTTALVHFINRSLSVWREKGYGEVVEEYMVRSENVATLAYLDNVLDDKELTQYLFRSIEAHEERGRLQGEVRGWIEDIEEEIDRLERTKEKLKKTSLKLELESLKRNSFDSIHDILK